MSLHPARKHSWSNSDCGTTALDTPSISHLAQLWNAFCFVQIFIIFKYCLYSLGYRTVQFWERNRIEKWNCINCVIGWDSEDGRSWRAIWVQQIIVRRTCLFPFSNLFHKSPYCCLTFRCETYLHLLDWCKRNHDKYLEITVTKLNYIFIKQNSKIR